MSEELIERLRAKQYELSYFFYGGRYSHEMGLRISAKTAQTSPAYDIEFQEIPGRDGDLAVDNKRLKPFRYPIHVHLVPEAENIHEAAAKISQWLKSDVRYKPLYLSWDPDYMYEAIFYEQYDIEDILPKFGKISLNFRCQPLKYRIDGLKPIEIEHGQTIYNPENRSAKPLIRIEGSGDIVFRNNGSDWLALYGVDGFITVDSKRQLVHKNNANQFEKMNATLTPLFPRLQPGANTITWSGHVTKVEITARWEAIV